MYVCMYICENMSVTEGWETLNQGGAAKSIYMPPCISPFSNFTPSSTAYIYIH